MAKTIGNLWAEPETKHLLYLHHIGFNFVDHIKPVFADHADFRTKLDFFWRLARESDPNSVVHFDEEFDKLRAVVETAPVDTQARLDKQQSAPNWPDSLSARMEREAAR